MGVSTDTMLEIYVTRKSGVKLSTAVKDGTSIKHTVIPSVSVYLLHQTATCFCYMASHYQTVCKNKMEILTVAWILISKPYRYCYIKYLGSIVSKIIWKVCKIVLKTEAMLKY